MGRGKADASIEHGAEAPRTRTKPAKRRVVKQRVVDSKNRQLELGADAFLEDGEKVKIKDIISLGRSSGMVRIRVIREDGQEDESYYGEELMTPPRTFRCHSLRAV